jgi:hypothetical protein
MYVRSVSLPSPSRIVQVCAGRGTAKQPRPKRQAQRSTTSTRLQLPAHTTCHKAPSSTSFKASPRSHRHTAARSRRPDTRRARRRPDGTDETPVGWQRARGGRRAARADAHRGLAVAEPEATEPPHMRVVSAVPVSQQSRVTPGAPPSMCHAVPTSRRRETHIRSSHVKYKVEFGTLHDKHKEHGYTGDIAHMPECVPFDSLPFTFRFRFGRGLDS